MSNPQTGFIPPAYRVHKATQQAYILIQGKRVYLGKADRPDTIQAYTRLTAEMAANGGMVRPTQQEATVKEICAHYWTEAEVYYRHEPGKKPDGSLLELKLAVQPLKDIYGETPAKDLGPTAIRTVREVFLSKGLSRTSINKRMGYIKRMIRWAAENEMIPPSTWHAVQCVSNLKRGRSVASEPRKVLPVPESHIELAKAHLTSVVRAMIDLQLCTGARPGEITGLRAVDIDVSGPVWIARVERHKTAYTGAERKIYIGPKGQAILKPFMASRPIHAQLFSPRESEAERHANAPKCHRRPDQKPNPKQTDRTLGDSYDSHSYRHAISRAMERVNKDRADDAKLPAWSPNQLRHNFATMVRRLGYGLDGAQVLLGHSDADITQVYAERDEKQALEIIARVG